MTYPGFIRWYLVGAIGIALVLTLRKWVLLPLLFLSVLLVPRIQTNWHSWLTREYSSVPAIAEFTNRNQETPSCIGFLSIDDSVGYDEEYLRMTFALTGRGLQRVASLSPQSKCRNFIAASESVANQGTFRIVITLKQFSYIVRN